MNDVTSVTFSATSIMLLIYVVKMEVCAIFRYISSV